ncbi:hypothetical protein K438DRAFT_1972032 [Mycena galopus ATCC 62051]|nr:hypothetical protein K438DRAFT_1972032 [Mycena galopus ATCC 62051]
MISGISFSLAPLDDLLLQFAYQEASFILTRILQAFCKISLAPDSQPPESRVPDDWKTETGDPSGQKKRKIRPKRRLWVTMLK